MTSDELERLDSLKRLKRLEDLRIPHHEINFLESYGVNSFWLQEKPHYRARDLDALNKIAPREASYAWVDSENCAYQFFVGHGWSKI